MNTPVKNKRNSGVSLIEVMVTVFILSIGLLGIAALQIQSKRVNLGAVERTTASMLANEMIERMRANPSALKDYLDEVSSSGIGEGNRAVPSLDCDTSEPCTAFDVVLHDLYQWEQSIMGAAETNTAGVQKGGLASPTACIDGPVVGGAGIYTVSIAWRGRGAISDPTPNDCGRGSGKYDGDEGTDVYRRLLTLNVFINDIF